MMKYTTETYINKCINIHENQYDYSLVSYIGSNEKVKIICKKHGIFEQRAFCHLQGQKCSKCQFDKKKKDKLDFIIKSNLKHKNKYDYSLVEFENRHEKVKIICKDHGIFEQRASDHLKSGCPKCYRDLTIKKNDVFIKECSKIHNHKYKYLSEYIKSHLNIKIDCPLHGIFEQKAYAHLQGQGCPKCAYDIYDKKSYIKKSNKIHNNFYNYQNVIYVKASSKVEIICPKHGIFYQSPHAHSSGQGCPRCSNLISSCEKIWLDKIGISVNNRQVKIGKHRVDGFDPITKTIYEFYGDYWHGNPQIYNPIDLNPTNKKKYADLYSKTISREKEIKDLGYNIVSIWESDFKKQYIDI